MTALSIVYKDKTALSIVSFFETWGSFGNGWQAQPDSANALIVTRQTAKEAVLAS